MPGIDVTTEKMMMVKFNYTENSTSFLPVWPFGQLRHLKEFKLVTAEPQDSAQSGSAIYSISSIVPL